jgi:hypothetical protein
MDATLDSTVNNHGGLVMSDSLTIRTNRQVRELVSWFEVPPAIREDWFSYLEDDERYSYRFVKYRGSWYDVNDSQWTGELGFNEAFKAWDAIVTESFSSGVLFRYAGSQSEFVIVGRYYS